MTREEKYGRKADSLRLKAESARERALALREKAEQAAVGTKARMKAQKAAAKEEAKVYKLSRSENLARGISNHTITDQEAKKIQASVRRHRFYDFVKFFVDMGHKKNPCTVEDSIVEHNGDVLTNKGRIYLGGTKPMYEYKDGADRSWLFKEAITCVGTSKPEGALVCEAAYNLQRAVNPGSAIATFAHRSADGKVLGSFQERVAVKKDAIDLFAWQTNLDRKLEGSLADQILREHAIDWLICNFDTKGENFVIDENGTLRGIDKEQAFSFLDDKNAAHMSTEYRPNPHDTLYNTVFTLYSKGEQELDLQKTTSIIQAVERLEPGQYMKLFEPAVIARCADDKQKQEKMRSQLLERKEGLREEYRSFYTKLVTERYKGKPEELAGMLREGRFEFADEREKRLAKDRAVEATQEKSAGGSGRQRITAKELTELEGKSRGGEPAKRTKVCRTPERVQERAGMRR